MNRPPHTTKVETAMALVRNSPLPVPVVRRAAIIESVRRAKDDVELIDIFLDATSGSPYLTKVQKERLTETLLRDEWESLAAHAGCPRAVGRPALHSNLAAFRRMARLLFCTSKKIRGLPLEVRRYLGTALADMSCADEIFNLLLTTALVDHWDRETGEKIANDICDLRFYRLLLPDRLDCEEPLPRIDSCKHEKNNECPICLDKLEDDCTRMPCCGHLFCTSCIQDWTTVQHRSCPWCRSTIPETIRRRSLHPTTSDDLPSLGSTRSHRWQHRELTDTRSHN